MIYTNCAACGAESTVLNPVEQASVTQGPGHRVLWTALLCQRCTIGMLDRATDKAPDAKPPTECESVEGSGSASGAATPTEYQPPFREPPEPSRIPPDSAPTCEQATGDGAGAATAREWTEEQRIAACDVAKLVLATTPTGRWESGPYDICAAIEKIAPKFVRVRLPRLRGIDEAYALTWNNAIDDCRDALRAQGIEVEP